MRRRLETPGGFNVWPAFTDVLGGLVVVLMFLITMFVIGEVLIGREMTGKDTAIGQLQRIIEHLELLTGAAEDEAQQLRGRVQDLEATVADRETLLRQVRGELAAAQETYRLLAQGLDEAQSQRQALEAAYAELDTAKTEAEQTVAALKEQAALLSARSERLAAELERLNRALIGSDEQLAAANAELARRGALITEQQTRIEAMDGLIKRRLLERVEELEKYASDFFGRLRKVFAGNPDIKVVGDRFVFQSEVLFSSGEVSLSPAGQADLDKFVAVYRQLAADLPPDLPVIIEVQGHTDRVPIRTSARFASNWELSTQRALDVVNYLIKQGLPPERLAAVGMGEYHPIDPENTPEAYRRNRRIELKITSR